MQSASDLPPPPGLLGADSLGLLPDEVPGERASDEPPEDPPPVAKLLGKGSDIGNSPGAVGVVVAGTPAGGVSPAEGVDDDDVDGAAGVVGPGDTGGVMVGKVGVGAETRGSVPRPGGSARRRTPASRLPTSVLALRRRREAAARERWLQGRAAWACALKSPWRCRHYP